MMFIDRNTEPFCINENISIVKALQHLSDSKNNTLFVVDTYFRLKGSFTDGDLRRWIVKQQSFDLKDPIKNIANKNMIYAYDHESKQQIADRLTAKIQFIPIIDAEEHVVGVASFRPVNLAIGRHSINQDAPVLTIAEIGNNHNGSLDLAYQLIDEAANAGVDAVKFQMRDLGSLYSNQGASNDDSEDLGSQYVLDLLSRFQLNDEDMFKAFDYATHKGLTVFCTPFDKVSADKLHKYGVPAYKVASADLTNHDLLSYIAAKGKPMLVSTGMATEQEIYEAVNLLRSESASYILLHCNSTYPAPFKDINLNYLSRLKEIGDCIVGYSGHERGYAVALAAVAQGAKVIEKHFTLDRSMEGNDHKVSLLPAELKEMVEGIRQIEVSLGTTKPRTLSQGELMNRETLAKSLVAEVDITPGQRIEKRMIGIKSPGKGLPPYRINELMGRIATRAMTAGDTFYESDISGRAFAPRNYTFQLPFGIPVRYHDVKTLAHRSNFKMIEFHLSYKDLDTNPFEYIDQAYPIQFAIHSPELFAGDHVLDLCSTDKEYRQHSIKELQRVIDITRSLKPYFPNTPRPCIVVNIGGFTDHAFLDDTTRKARYELFADSLKQLDRDGVELIPQTMPPFPWHFGGQRYHNLFVSAEDIEEQCKLHDLRVCFDVSHSKLACNYHHWDFEEFVTKVAPYSAHLHIADAKDIDGEGLQIDEGEIDFVSLAYLLRLHCAEATWIPEIWQGHKNEGEGFWKAFNRLEGLL